jgi:hypothetical protein
LHDLWTQTRKSYQFAKPSSKLDPEVVPKVISLLRGEGTKRGDLLKLDFQDFEDDWADSCKYLNIAYTRLLKQYGVLTLPKWLPYSSMIVPLAAILRFLNIRKLDYKDNYSRIDQWYWTSVFSNRYDEGAMSKQTSDFNALKEWAIDSRKVPSFIKEFNPIADVDLTVDKQNSATYKGVINLIVLEGAFDFLTGQQPQLDEDHVQDDHIFPKSIYDEHLILNRTLLTTNAKKSKARPSDYFERQMKQHGEIQLKRILVSHLIPEDALQYLLSDDIDKFLKARKKTIQKKIKQKVRIPT